MDNSITSHLSNHQTGSAPSSPSMSQSQQGGQSRQPVSYPSPTSYPSPGLSSSQYSYPAPNNQPANEPYRASPTGSNGSLSLPSMRSLDPLQQQPHQPHMGSPLPPPVAQMAPYFHGNPHPAHQYPNVTSDPSQANMRYALPVPDNRVMSGGRHKKEIKRRTKTGCLTCRKRRIKCDEAHPACRNCQKSKRECLGYDPIFKQQPGPAPIQPAPSSAPSQVPVAAPAHPYGNQPAMLQAYGAGVPNMGYDPALPADESSPGSTSHAFDYSSAIDPALEAAAPAPNANQFQQAAMPGYREDLKRDMHSASPYSSGTDSPHIRGGASSFISPSSSQLTHEDSSTYATHPAKGMTIEALLPAMPNTPEFTGDNSQLDEIKHIWYSIYVPGLENFLESKWFTLRGITDLVQSKDLLNQFAVLLDCFGKTASSDPDGMAFTSGVEARLVWSLLCMVRTSTQPATGDSVTTNDNVVDARSRLSVFEHLLTGQPASSNPLTKTPHSSTIPHHKQRELDFWHTLGEFVTQMDGPDTKKIDDTLVALRGLLDGRENRDVLYSIAVVRGISNRVAEYSYHDRPLHLDETDQRSKLAVAKQFVKDEADGSGTTNVIRRLCELATRSWTAPRPTLSAQK